MNKLFFIIGILILLFSCSTYKSEYTKKANEQNDCNYKSLIIKKDSGWFYNLDFNPKDYTYKNLLLEDTLKKYIGKDMCYFINNVGKNWMRSGLEIEYYRLRWYEFQYPDKIIVMIFFKNYIEIDNSKINIDPRNVNYIDENIFKMLIKDSITEIRVISFGEIKKRIVIK